MFDTESARGIVLCELLVRAGAEAVFFAVYIRLWDTFSRFCTKAFAMGGRLVGWLVISTFVLTCFMAHVCIWVFIVQNYDPLETLSVGRSVPKRTNSIHFYMVCRMVYLTARVRWN